MHVPKGWNINTTIAVCGFALTLIVSVLGWTASATTFKASVDEMGRKYDGWIANHEQTHKDRLATVTGIEARTDQRLSNLEGETRKIDELAYRLTIQEQGSANLARSVEELKTSVNSLGTDIRVMREILQRLDPRTTP
ncbi:hypothetical protein [Devosia sp. 2618]|uniref:hypothetical protein n=1 Tax=Devosia sp. 2618 TaxID=3156454 RepID=UPI003397D2C1